MTYPDILPNQINDVVQQSANAFMIYNQYTLQKRVELLYTIAHLLDQKSETLIASAASETQLSITRLKTELSRTCWQLKSYADYCKSGQGLQIRIDTGGENNHLNDLRKMQVPLGPVAIFGAANFPFAYSTAGGDTASALAAGCTVIVKAHPGHAHTSQLIAGIVTASLALLKMPETIFQHIHGASYEVGKALVSHPLLKAVGFTGSQKGGKQIYDWCQQRRQPIPVFAEMSSINPIFMLPEKLHTEAEPYAKLFAASISNSAGQFCTCPGIIVGIKSEGFEKFMRALSQNVSTLAATPMLNKGIFENYLFTKDTVIQQETVHELNNPSCNANTNEVAPALARVNAQDFIKTPQFMQEVFGPFALFVQCNDEKEMLLVAQQLEGQLTASVIATEEEMITHKALISALIQKCGRFIYNGVPTGVQVSLAMQHGGPFPATTDSRFTAVGGDAINRFTRPVCFQNLPHHLLPDELKPGNPLQIWRTINNIPGTK